MTKMTVNQMVNEIIANVKAVKEIGIAKRKAGTQLEILQLRTKAFGDVITWYNNGCTSSRPKAEMELLHKRSIRMVENFNRL